MTQMLLFETPVGIVDPSLVPVAVRTQTESDRPDPARANEVTQIESGSGLHHLGDLARLVLLRYDLMAKRREQLAARRPR